VCRRLRHLGVPFVVHTGYPRMLVEQQWPDVPVICKPARPEVIVDELTRLLGISALPAGQSGAKA
jgi:hypothetical protein